MKIYFAPMEGITLYPLRNVHHSMFGDGVDKYFTPFLTAHSNYHFKKREKKDVMPELTEGFDDYGNRIIPQIMANKADTFIWAAKQMRELGYNEVNLNLGCPVATVTNRHKGSGMLLDMDYLDSMLDAIFKECTDISVKTRLGFYDEEESLKLMQILSKYPLKEITVHARIREDFYKGEPRTDAYAKAVKAYRENGGKASVCYNGNIFTVKDYENISEKICGESKEQQEQQEQHLIDAIMLGRGLLADPSLARQLKGGSKLEATELREYLDRLYTEYEKFILEDRNVVFKMLEHWAFLHVHFKDCDKYLKIIRKSRSKGEYIAAVNNIFASCEFL